MSLFHESLERLLSGVTLSGYVAVAGDDTPTLREAALLVERIARSEGLHEWLLEIVVTLGGNGQKCSVKCDVRWAASTPILTITDTEIPGIGIVTAKLMIHNCLFAGTWNHDREHGQVWGAVVSPLEPKHRKRFVIERTSEFLREWWTGSDWSKNDCNANWYEHEPDGPRETEDEEARAVFYPSGKVEAG